MSAVTGKLLTCDRCGESVFLKCVGEGETDGGYTRWNKFEGAPEGWGHHLCHDLCPKCYAEWKKIEAKFFGKGE